MYCAGISTLSQPLAESFLSNSFNTN